MKHDAMANYVVREATRADTAELARLRWNFRAEDGLPKQSRDEFEVAWTAWTDRAFASDRWLIAVADAGAGVLCGCMFLEFVEKVPSPDGAAHEWGYVTNAYVEPEWRNQGVGRRLVDVLIDAARKRRVEFLIVWPSKAAVSLYRRAGFRPVEEVHVDDDEPPLEFVF
jgi:ribosomal protein S18 acetylase RimI-like enzyme